MCMCALVMYVMLCYVMYACTHAHTHACMYVCMYVCMCIYFKKYLYIHTYTSYRWNDNMCGQF